MPGTVQALEHRWKTKIVPASQNNDSNGEDKCQDVHRDRKVELHPSVLLAIVPAPEFSERNAKKSRHKKISLPRVEGI